MTHVAVVHDGRAQITPYFRASLFLRFEEPPNHPGHRIRSCARHIFWDRRWPRSRCRRTVRLTFVVHMRHWPAARPQESRLAKLWAFRQNEQKADLTCHGSTYGNRSASTLDPCQVGGTDSPDCEPAGGLVPAFAVERTQISLRPTRLISSGQLPAIPSLLR